MTDPIITAARADIDDTIRAEADLFRLVAGAHPEVALMAAVERVIHLERLAEERREDRDEARSQRDEADGLRAVACNEIDRLTAHLDQIAAAAGDGSAEDVTGRIVAEIEKMRARVAELEARPVLTAQALCDALVNARDRGENMFVPAGVAEDVANQIAALGPVTLPTPDRAEELIAAYVDEYADTEERDGNPPPRKWREVEQERRDWSIGVMRRALAKLATPAAPAVEAAPAAAPKSPRFKVVKAADVPPAPAARWFFLRTSAERAAGDLNAGRGLSWDLRCPHARPDLTRTNYAVIDTRPEEG